MAVVALQILGLVMGLLGWILDTVATSSQTWKVSTKVDSVITANWVFEGLWMQCAATALGSIQCKKFPTVLGLDDLSPPDSRWSYGNMQFNHLSSYQSFS